MVTLIPLLIILSLFGTVFLFIRWMLKSLMDGLRKQYQLFSKNLGVAAEITDAKLFGFRRMPSLNGSINNRGFKLYSLPAGMGRSMQSNDTFFEIASPKLTGFSFSMAPKTLSYKLDEALGTNYIKTGVQQFDDQFVLHSNNINFLKKGLDSELRKVLMENKDFFKNSLELNEQGILQYSELINIAKDKDRIRFEKLISLSSKMLDVFERNAEPIV